MLPVNFFQLLVVTISTLSSCDCYSLRLAPRMSLAHRITQAVNYKFKSSPVPRVIACFDRFCMGVELDKRLGDGSSEHNRVKANCFVEGLTQATFHDKNNGKFPWALKLEESGLAVAKELKSFLASGDEKWAGPRFVGTHYGPEWRTLGLQDRGLWDAENVDIFPKTVELLKSLKVPSQEAFFTRQGPKSGIQPHSDLNNFILTAHLALDVPEGECWIRVGDDKYYWKNGEVSIFDTSIFHSTWNDADRDRFVLLIRFWHPDLTQDEVKAFTLIFDMLDVASEGDQALAYFEARSVYNDVAPVAPQISTSAAGAGAEGPDQPPQLTRQQRRELEKKSGKKSVSTTATGIGSSSSSNVNSDAGVVVEKTKGFHRGK